MIDVSTLAMNKVSADSHVTEPPNCYLDYIDPGYRDRAPKVVRGPAGGDVFVVDGLPGFIPMGIISAAGKNPKDIRLDEARFEDLHKGGWDPLARLLDQKRDGVVAEVIYPTVGMALCNLNDLQYQSACFRAYNRWLEEFVSAAPDRYIGIGQTAVASVEEAIQDLYDIKDQGLQGVMLPGEPGTSFDYDNPAFDPLWQAAVDLKMPLSFHTLTSGRGKNSMGIFSETRGPKENRSHSFIRANQDIIGMFIWSRIFERFPELKIVSVESDAGWAPHFIYKLDYHYDRRRYWSGFYDMEKRPGDYFRDNVCLTFQDDYVALKTVDLMNYKNLLWANDFPHSDSTWPLSYKFFNLASVLTDEQRLGIFRNNVRSLYGLD